MNKPLILGVHGLNNKPAPGVLADWWERSLREGLARNCGLANPDLAFRLVYWADILHPTALTDATDKAPYAPANGEGALAAGARGLRRRAVSLGLEAAGKLAERIAAAPLIEDVLDEVIEAKANDLFRYQTEPAVRDAIRARLTAALDLARAEGRPVTLIAHSMGSIIAYDVLRADPAIEIAHLITIGAPLGISEVKRASRREFGRARVPEGVRRWTNLADPRDPVCMMDVRLRSDYDASPTGVRVRDGRVSNGYVSPAGKANPHKIYGYLRTPEMSALIAEALGVGAAVRAHG
jgi:hypothetical protein